MSLPEMRSSSGCGRRTGSKRPSSPRARTASRPSSSSRCRTPAAAFPPRPDISSGCGRSATRTSVLLVSDEVICAYGRLGTMFGAQKYGYQPDIITTAKGLTSGYSPLGAAIISDRDLRALRSRQDRLPARLHLRRPSGRPAPLPWPTWTFSSARTCWAMCSAKKTPSGRPWRSSTTCRSSAMFAVTAISMLSSWSRTKPPNRPWTPTRVERVLRGYVSGALFENGLYCRTDDRGEPVVQVAPPLICGQAEFDEMEQILRYVLTEAWTKI